MIKLLISVVVVAIVAVFIVLFMSPLLHDCHHADVTIGMDKADVVKACGSVPKRKSIDQYEKNSIHEQWIYDHDVYIYIDYGVVGRKSWRE